MKRRASARKSSSASSTSTRRKAAAAPRFAVCVRNEGYEASLERNKIYEVLLDDDAERHGDLRVVDESGEDYLFCSPPIASSRSTYRQQSGLAAEGFAHLNSFARICEPNDRGRLRSASIDEDEGQPTSIFRRRL